MVKTDSTTTVARRRCDKGHLIRVGRNRCDGCYLKKRYHERRALGMDSYVASCQNKSNKRLNNTINGLATYHKKRLMGYTYFEANNTTRVKEKERLRKHRKKQIELYGGDTTKDTVARLRWLIDIEGIHTTSD